MKKKLWQWKRSWSKLAFVSTIALSSAGTAAAASLSHLGLRQPLK